jgi:cytidylate kinase
MIIAVDGPAASGKGTIARALAHHYRLPHLDTGLLYRAVAATVLHHELDPEIEADAVASCDFDDLLLGDPELRTDEIGQAASVVSAHPLVRAALLQRQRRFAHQPGGAVLEGRDIGTVFAPEAGVKLFVTARPEIRARRRFAELKARGLEVHYPDVLADIRARDERDTGRDAAPLVMAKGAILLDTSDMDVNAAIAAAISAAEAASA